MKSVLKTLILGLALAVTQSAYALTAADLTIPTQIPDLEEQIEGTLSPKFPASGDKVTITLEAYGTDLNRANIIWSVDGVETTKGKGQKTFTTVAGALGTTQTVRALITPTNGPSVTKVFYINAQGVDLVWQADTYTPPFYRGKAMFSPQNRVTVVAIPNLVGSSGAQIDPSDVTYKWKKDFVVQGKVSGYGVRSFSYKGDILMQPVNIGLEASIAGGSTAVAYINLAPKFPEINIYEESPIYGILWGHELSGAIDFGAATEKSITAVPYFFGVKERNDSVLNYGWSINSSAIDVPTNQTTVTFRNSDDLEGMSRIGVSINNRKNLLEEAAGGSTIIFKKPTKTLSL